MRRRTTFSPGVRKRHNPAWKLSEAKGVVYFITCAVPDFPIKIGFAGDLTKRVCSIQTSLPYQVKVLHHVEGDRFLERELKAKFSRLQVRGEWFRQDPELLDFIADLAAGPVAEISAPHVTGVERLRLGL